MITGTNAREIAASVESGVAAGRLRPGERLPSVRGLAAELSVSPSTVASAVADLRRRGVVVSRPRSGLQVADRPPLTAPAPAAPVPDGVRDLAIGNPDPAFLPDLRPALRAVGGAPPLLYGEEGVVPELRAVASRALSADGVDPSDLCVVNGALDGIERVLGAHLAGGDPVAVEDPGFPGVLDVVRALGLPPIPVPLDERGMRPAALDAALRHGARAVILTPRGQNPTGAHLDAGRARELARVMARHPGVLLVEDDHLGPVGGAPYITGTAGLSRWAVVRSVSKWLGPDLRLAVLAGDRVTLARVEGRQAVGPGWVSALVQRIVATLWDDPEVVALAEQATTVYAGRRRALLDALAAAGPGMGMGESGLNVWVPVSDEDAAVRSLAAAGFAVSAGSRYRLRSAPGIRITTAALRPAEAAEVAAALRPSGRTRAA